MRSCEMEDQSKNDTCMLSGVGVILYGGMACTVSEAQLGCQATAFLPREEALYITQYIILRHSERSSLISTFSTSVKARSTSLVATHSPESQGHPATSLMIYMNTYTLMVLQEIDGIVHFLTHHTAFTTYRGDRRSSSRRSASNIGRRIKILLLSLTSNITTRFIAERPNVFLKQ
jgi:hypothetical protein